MGTLTTKYNLIKPATTDAVSIEDINENMDIIDSSMDAMNTVVEIHSEHVDDATIHITESERTTWNSKTDDSNLNTHKNDTTIHITESERTTWNAKLGKSGGTMTGALIAQTNTDYATRQVRNVIISTSDPSGGSSGDIWIKYTE